MKKILIVYYSKNGAIEKMSEKISRGINSVENSEAIIRTLPDIENHNTGTIANKNNILYATNDDLKDCDGLILGSPTYFGNMAAPMKFFLDGTSAEWFNNTLSGKPAGVFTSSSSMSSMSPCVGAGHDGRHQYTCWLPLTLGVRPNRFCDVWEPPCCFPRASLNGRT